MSPMKKRRQYPMLLGEPSPSLAKIGKMNMEELKERIEALAVEKARIDEKIKNLSNMQPRDDARIESLSTQAARLTALSNAAKDRLSGKQDRTSQYRGRDFRSPRR